MKLFQKQEPGVLALPESRKVIRMYNRLNYTLVKYQVLYHHAWCKQVEQAKCGKYAVLHLV